MSRLINRNVTGTAGRTSMRLEPELWGALEEICHREDRTMSAVVKEIEGRRLPGGRTSALRVYVLDYYRKAAPRQGTPPPAMARSTGPKAPAGVLLPWGQPMSAKPRFMANAEMAAMMDAYKALLPLASDRHATARALAWVGAMLESDRRDHLAAAATGIEPEKWAISPSWELTGTAQECAEEYGERGTVLELDGIAIVRRRFAVMVPTDDGDVIEWFPTREEAQAMVDRIKAWGTEDRAEGTTDAQ